METTGTYTINLTESEQTIVAELTDPIVLAAAEALHLERQNIAQRISELLKNYQGLLILYPQLRDDLTELSKSIESGDFAVELEA